VITLIVQGLEYSVSSFTISDGVFGTCFFFGTGFHGLVLLIFNYNTNIHSIHSSGAKRPSKSLSVINKRFFSTIKVKDVELCPN
jgi:heme/copper-type cytochrome/quinol oxidase subunit 3